MKSLIILFALFSLISSEEINLQSKKPIEIVTCLLQSEVLMKDLNKLIELIKEGDYMKLVLELIEMYPAAYQEIMKCVNQEINLNTEYGCKLGDKDKCCWMNNNGCCKPPKRGQMCTQAFRRCCKRKVYNEETGQYTIEYD